MNIQQYLKWTLPLAIVSAIASPAQANNCNEPSELMQSLGEGYANLQYPYGDDLQDEASTQRMFETISQKTIRSGKGIRVKCAGTTSRSQGTRTKFYLTDIRFNNTANGNIQLTAWEESSRKALSSVIDLPPADRWEKQSNNSFKTNQLFRHTNKRINKIDPQLTLDQHLRDNYLYTPGTEAEKYLIEPELSIAKLPRADDELQEFPNLQGSYVAEIETLVQRTTRGYTVTQSFFVNGYKAEWVTWQLGS